jgi:hypothetical protein
LSLEKPKIRLLKDQSMLDKLVADVPPGQYRLYEPLEIPSYLSTSRNPRGRYRNTCVLILATTWDPKSNLYGYNPSGILYYVSTFRDDLDRSHQQEFNKDVQLIFKNTDGKPYTAHLYDPSEHSISAVATGTSLPFLKKAFRLPDAKTGAIDDLIECNTSIGPYPTDSS